MINALYESFPESIKADGKTYPIITDFREWIRFSDMMSDKELSTELKIYLLTEWLLKPPEKVTVSLVNAVFDFFRAAQLEPESVDDEGGEEQEMPVKPPVFDWKIDAKYVIGDFRHYYGIDLLTVKYMHWWEFRCLFSALPEDSICNKRIAYRSANLSEIKNDAERERIRKIQLKIALPFEYNDDMIGSALGKMMM